MASWGHLVTSVSRTAGPSASRMPSHLRAVTLYLPDPGDHVQSSLRVRTWVGWSCRILALKVAFHWGQMQSSPLCGLLPSVLQSLSHAGPVSSALAPGTRVNILLWPRVACGISLGPT